MRPTWKFFGGLAAGFALAFGLTATAFWVSLGVPTGTSHWAFELNRRKQLMAETAGTPKLLVVGGSATLFGVSARVIEEQTGLHTVNLGTHAALGTAYILQLARAAAKPGDTVLLVLEYELYNYGQVNQTWADRLLVDYLVARDPAFFRHLSLREQWTVFMLTSDGRLLEGLKNRFRGEPPFDESGLGVYSTRHLNEWGDLTQHTRAHRQAQREIVMRTKSALAKGLSEHAQGFAPIADFCRWAKTNHVRVLATFPNLCDRPEYHAAAAQRGIQTVEKFFGGLGVPVIGNYTDALLPEDDFLDTMYHPTEEAAIARSQRLASKLKALAKPHPAGSL
jgi:hypothetical protein